MPFFFGKLLKMFNTEKISWQEVENAKVLVKTGHTINESSFFSQKLKMKPLIFQIQN